MANIVISRIQHRRGRRENLPQPLLPAEVALTSDTSQAWIGQDPILAVPSINVYADKLEVTAQSIVDNNILETRFDESMSSSIFDLLVSELTTAGGVTLVAADILWDSTYRGAIETISFTGAGIGYTTGDVITAISPTGTGFVGTVTAAAGDITAINITSGGSNYQSANTTFSIAGGGSGVTLSVAVTDIYGSTVHIAANPTIAVGNTISNIGTTIDGLTVTITDRLMGELPTPTGANVAFGTASGNIFGSNTLLADNHTEAANVVALINRVNGTTPNEITGLVFTNLNIEITGGSSSATTVLDGTGNPQPIGYNTIPIYEIDVNAVFDVAHQGMMWHKDSGGAATFTCDNVPSISQGASWAVHNADTENLTIAEGGGVTINFLVAGAAPVTGSFIIEQGGVATIYKYSDTEYWAWGNTAPAGYASVTGTPVDDQLAVWTNGTTIEGDAGLTWDGTKLTVTGAEFIVEQAAQEAPVAGQGQLWVRSDTPNVLVYTDDAGTDFDLNASSLADGTVEGNMLFWNNTGGTWDEAGQAQYTGGVLFMTRPIRVQQDLALQLWSTTGAAQTYVGTQSYGVLQVSSAANVKGVELAGGITLFSTGQAAANVGIAGRSQYWTRNSTPSVPMFTDTNAVDHVLNNIHETEYEYSSTVTATDPTAGTLQFDSITIGSITNLYISDLDNVAKDAGWLLSNLATGDVLTIRSTGDPADYIIASVTSAPTDNTGWWTIPLTLINTGTIFTNGDELRITVEWFSAASSVPDGAADNEILHWDQTTNQVWVVNGKVKILDNIASSTGGQVEVTVASGNNSVAEAVYHVTSTATDPEIYLLGAVNSGATDSIGLAWDKTLSSSNETFTIEWAGFAGGTAPFQLQKGGSIFLGNGGIRIVDQKLYHGEIADAGPDVTGEGQIWVHDDVPNTLWFTNDIGQDQQVRTSLSELVVATNVITAGESGKTFYLDAAGGFTSTLPAPALGLKFKFIVKTAPTTAYIITTNASANILQGTFLDIVGELQAISAQDTINFVASTSLIGDSLEVESDGVNWHCTAFSKADGGITVAVT